MITRIDIFCVPHHIFIITVKDSIFSSDGFGKVIKKQSRPSAGLLVAAVARGYARWSRPSCWWPGQHGLGGHTPGSTIFKSTKPPATT